jgi:hypothetical protein
MEAGLRIRSLFQFRRSSSCPTTKGNIRAAFKIQKENQTMAGELSTKKRKSFAANEHAGA